MTIGKGRPCNGGDGIKGLIRCAAAVMFLVSAAWPALLDAQVIRGRLLDAETDAPVPAGRVLAIDSAFGSVASALSDARGRFTLRVGGGIQSVSVFASALAYRSYVDGPFDLAAGDTLALEFRIQPFPIPVDSLSVSVEGRLKRLEMSGFYQRRAMEPGGVFLERPELKEKPAVRASDLFRRLSGVFVVPARNGLGGWKVLLRSRCLPVVFIDGVRVRSPKYGGGLIDDWLHPDEIEGIEIYRSPAQVPLQYGGTGAKCGVIVMWTR